MMKLSKVSQVVTPAKAGVQTPSQRKPGTIQKNLDSGFRRTDGFFDFLRDYPRSFVL